MITYDAFVRGNSTQTIVNKVTVNGDEETISESSDYGAPEEGSGSIASFKIVKVDGYDANKKLSGVRFRVFAENEDLDFGEGNDHVKVIELVTDEKGEIVFDGEDYDFYFDEVYHVQEVEPLEDYGKIGFDYLVTLTTNMALVDYGHYIYYFSDTMQIKNWPLEGLVVEKEVESDDPADKSRFYSFRISILDADGNLDTNYNEKNGDDQFVNGVFEFHLKHGEQKMFWGFLKGTRYRVEEIDAEGFATSVTYSIFDEDGNVTETKTDAGTSHSGELTREDELIIFTNSRVGSLKIKKNVTVNGQPTTTAAADGTYTFTITGPNDYESTQTITITNGASNEVQVDNLLPGDYTVNEDTSKNPAGMSLVGGNGKTVTVTANNTEAVPTAEFTNDCSQSCEGEIMVRKVLNGRPWTYNDSFTFTISAREGTPMPPQTTITITRRDPDQTRSFGTIVFTQAGTYVYSVSELRGGDRHLRYDTREHTVTIEVVSDGNGNLVAKEGTQLIRTVTLLGPDDCIRGGTGGRGYPT